MKIVQRLMIGLCLIQILTLGIIGYQWSEISQLKDSQKTAKPVASIDASTKLVNVPLSNYKGSYETTTITVGEYLKRPFDMKAPARSSWITADGKFIDYNDYKRFEQWNRDKEIDHLSQRVAVWDLYGSVLGRVWMSDFMENHNFTPVVRNKFLYDFPLSIEGQIVMDKLRK